MRTMMLAAAGALVAAGLVAAARSISSDLRLSEPTMQQPRRLTADETGSSRLVLAFRLRDCASGIERLRAWNPVRTSLPIQGVLLHDSVRASNAEDALRRAGLLYPVIPDSRGNIARLLSETGYASGPVALLFDPEGRLVRVVDLGALAPAELQSLVVATLELARQHDAMAEKTVS